jgi:hypothetical protein
MMASSRESEPPRVSLGQLVDGHFRRLRGLFDPAGILLCGTQAVSERDFAAFRRNRLPETGGPGFASIHGSAQVWVSAHFFQDLVRLHALYLEQTRQFCVALETTRLDLTAAERKERLGAEMAKRPTSLAAAVEFFTEWAGEKPAHADVLAGLESLQRAFAAGPGSVRLLRPTADGGVESFEVSWTAAQRPKLLAAVLGPLFFTVGLAGRDVAAAVAKGAERKPEPATQTK